MRKPDTTPDDELGAALREAAPAPPADAVDWSALQQRIVARAAPLLADRGRARPGVWQTLSGWAGRAIPLTAAAAAVVLLVLLRDGISRGFDEGATTGMHATVEEALTDDLASGSTPLLIAGAPDDALVRALLFDDETERR